MMATLLLQAAATPVPQVIHGPDSGLAWFIVTLVKMIVVFTV